MVERSGRYDEKRVVGESQNMSDDVQTADAVIGVGLVGCGDIAPSHARSIRGTGSTKLVACMDVVEAPAKSLGEEYPKRQRRSSVKGIMKRRDN